jgi:hypothetical protein
LVISFRLTNIPTTFQVLINNILYKYLDNFIVIYLNDILIFTKEIKEEYIDKVRLIFKKIRKYNLLLKSEKYEFFKKKVNFLEYIISIERIRIDLNKIKTILK